MARSRRRPEDLRSHRWFGVKDRRSFGHRSRALQMGYSREDFAGKPVIGIINTWSDINKCHARFRTRADEVKRGVWQPRRAPYTRGYGALYARHITQADKGCDFDFLHHGPPTPDPEIH
ncbi:MAG: dihydroxy-acid dehydratase [Betaproteobacteria bacterium]|nr:dihydroxy-acid dehydratase [Betaproteobacteria bacterium]